MRKETNDETRSRIERDLKYSTAKYADYAENEISKLQQAYLQKYYPVQRPEDVRNKKFGGKVSALFRGRRENLRDVAVSEEGIADITHGFQVILLSQPSGLVSDDCRLAVSSLNVCRWVRIEHLEDGYHVSGTLCFDSIDLC